jgi:L-ascorbate metabolism protein UlaG (beta-lactamase superfamily)
MSDIEPSRMGGSFGRVVGSNLARSFVGLTGDSAVFGASAVGARRDRIENSQRFARGMFRNTKSHDELAHLRVGSMSGPAAEYFRFGVERTPKHALPMNEHTADLLRERDNDGLRITWLGHSTVVIEIDGVRVLTDPVFGERASPSSLVGPRRFHKTPLPLSALVDGFVDVVTVSHDHYDHLDYPTVLQLAKTSLPIVCPLGVGAHLEAWGIASSRITELDWWDEHVVTTPRGRLRIVSAPAQHFSGRRIDDENSTLWTSFAYIGDHHRVFFSGDSGLTDEFQQIGDRLGGERGFDVTMIEVGAFHPAWGDIHLGPKNALEAHRLLRGQRLLPVHWATFNLALHAWNEPAETLLGLAAESDSAVLTPQLGTPWTPADTTPRWWRELQR